MATSPLISLRFHNNLKENREAQRLLYGRTFKAKADKVVALLLLGYGVYYLWVTGWQWWLVLLFLLALSIGFDWLSWSQLAPAIEFRRNPILSEEFHLTFSPENIHFQTASLDSTIQWTHYHDFIESPNLFLLLYGRGLFTLVPKRAFPSSQQLEAFRALIQEKISR